MQNVHSKKWIDPEKDDRIKERKEIEFQHEIQLAKNIREANKIAREMGFQADYSGIDIRAANEWNVGLYNAKRDFPEVTKKIKFVGSSQKRNHLIRKAATKYYYESLISNGYPKKEAESASKKLGRKIIGNVNSNEMASSIGLESIKGLPLGLKEAVSQYVGITMNDKYFDNYGRVIENGLRQVKSKWHPEGCFNVKATFDHEFAHQIDEHLEVGKNKTIQKIFEDRTNEKITHDLCRYAWDNDNPKKYSEMIAEGWSEYCNSKKPREMATIIGEEIIKLWKKKNF
ncbi:hypothetical protein [Allofustis seminis]|uniref:hypothetical protein n=1 Tax=Allofustis seminis TaxID=166939 RepID=UPI00036728C2|nr:hypothetical protein [Allofustis seminis]